MLTKNNVYVLASRLIVDPMTLFFNRQVFHQMIQKQEIEVFSERFIKTEGPLDPSWSVNKIGFHGKEQRSLSSSHNFEVLKSIVGGISPSVIHTWCKAMANGDWLSRQLHQTLTEATQTSLF